MKLYKYTDRTNDGYLVKETIEVNVYTWFSFVFSAFFNKFKILTTLRHKLFECPTFWKLKPAFECPACGKKYRCYWDGHDIQEVGTNLCKKCASHYYSQERQYLESKEALKHRRD